MSFCIWIDCQWLSLMTATDGSDFFSLKGCWISAQGKLALRAPPGVMPNSALKGKGILCS